MRYGITTLCVAVLVSASTLAPVQAQTFTLLHPFTETVSGINSDGALPSGGLILSGNTLYGTTSSGGTWGNGTVFSFETNGTGPTILHSFTGLSGSFIPLTNSDGARPFAGLILSGNTLYGTAAGGGSSGCGTIFRVNIDGTRFTILHSFTGSDGDEPYAALVISGNTLYGTTAVGGIGGYGSVFAITTNGTGFTNLYIFTGGSDGRQPYANLVLSGTSLYGTAVEGGNFNHNFSYGTVFRLNTDGTGFTNLYAFTGISDGAGPFAGLILSGNTLYGATQAGGTSGGGTVFRLNTDGTGFTTMSSFDAGPNGTNGGSTGVGFILGNTLFGTTAFGGNPGYGAVFTINTNGTGFTNLYNFTGGSDGSQSAGGLVSSGTALYGTSLGDGSGNGTIFKVTTSYTGLTTLLNLGNGNDGSNLYAGLILSGNTLYGATQAGGISGGGTVFAVNTDGTGFTTLHGFSATLGYLSTNRDGAHPSAGLILSGNTLYGTTQFGGSSGNGTVFAVTTTGSFTNLHSFTATLGNPPFINIDGTHPVAGLILAGNALFGTASQGGTSGDGTVFKINTDGSGFTTLHSFTRSDGASPYAGLILSGNTLYGTAIQGGTSGGGTVFAVNTDGTGFKTLYNFMDGGDGAFPSAGLILSGTSLYGTTQSGGFSGSGTVFSLKTNGTGFTNLYSFTANVSFPYTNSDGAFPEAGLVLSGNFLYGTAVEGGSWGYGTVFMVDTNGTGFADLYNFTDGIDGGYPYAELVLSDNALYGTASEGGSWGYGTVFRLALGSVSGPLLSIFNSGANVILMWPTNAIGYTLQSTTDLSRAVWSTNLTTSAVINGQYTVTNAMSGTRHFYRLSSQ